MQFLNLTLPSLPESLALDEALLLQAEDGQGDEVLRVWSWQRAAVVLGASGIVADDVDVAICAADGVPLERRASGGGTVLLGRGCLMFSLVLDMTGAVELTQIGSSYRFILGRMAEALADLAPGIEPAGVSDLAIRGRQLSGDAQQRQRRLLFLHGT